MSKWYIILLWSTGRDKLLEPRYRLLLPAYTRVKSKSLTTLLGDFLVQPFYTIYQSRHVNVIHHMCECLYVCDLL